LKLVLPIPGGETQPSQAFRKCKTTVLQDRQQTPILTTSLRTPHCMLWCTWLQTCT